MSAPLESAAPAKINLALHVTGQRADGYHLIESLVVFAGPGDRVAVEAADQDDFSVTGPFASSLPAAEGNLVLRVRDLLRLYFGAAAQHPVALKLEKNLPVASGIGGGSSDAAAAFRLLVRHWKLDASQEDLARIALELGADVPMCLASRPLVARGIGEKLEPAAGFPSLPLLLINPGVPLETRAVFARLVKRANQGLGALPRCESLAGIVRWLHSTRNDLQAPALSLLPEIADALGLLDAQGALLSRMSGSGATCFGIFGSAEAAEEAAGKITRQRPGWFVCPTATLSAEHHHG